MKYVGVSALALWLAMIAQMALADRMVILNARPDFILTTALSLSLLAPAPGQIWIGFASGVLQGILGGANIVQYVLTRIIACYGVGKAADLELEFGIVLGAVTVVLGTLVAQLLLMFIAPPRSILGFVQDTIAGAVFNGVLALPIYGVLRLALKRPRS